MRIWMLVDLEPGYERLDVGDMIEGTTMWRSPESLPPEIVSWDVPAWIEKAPDFRPGEHEWVAHLGDGVSALLRRWDGDEGEARISGCLDYDRHLRVFHATIPTARGRILRRAQITKKADRAPTGHPGWYTVCPFGPAALADFGAPVPRDRTVTSFCVQLDTGR
jgi:hypothetical protein